MDCNRKYLLHCTTGRCAIHEICKVLMILVMGSCEQDLAMFTHIIRMEYTAKSGQLGIMLLSPHDQKVRDAFNLHSYPDSNHENLTWLRSHIWRSWHQANMYKVKMFQLQSMSDAIICVISEIFQPQSMSHIH